MIIPSFVSLLDWANSLLIDFPSENVPVLYNDNWKEWGNMLIDGPLFSANGAPPTDTYSEWQPWAYAVYLAMLNSV